MNLRDLSGMKVTIMGLGLHGGGIESARFFAKAGARVLVTDLRKSEILKPSIDALGDFAIDFVLGEHRIDDFATADLVIKNPAVKRNNPFLQAAKAVHTDISVFLSLYKGPVLGITGTKGKSSTSSALAHGLRTVIPSTRLGGNITVSPLGFLTEIEKTPNTPVVLELSSFQLGDLLMSATNLSLQFSAITNIHRDHQDYYGEMEAYVQDKERIFLQQRPETWACFFADQGEWTNRFLSRLPRGVQGMVVGSKWEAVQNYPGSLGRLWLDEGRGLYRAPYSEGAPIELVPSEVQVPGDHQKINLGVAAIGMLQQGIDGESIRQGLCSFGGIPHRLEFVGTLDGVRVYNDSAATIPEAVVAATTSFSGPIHLICGGTDKDLDFRALGSLTNRCSSISVLGGTASGKIMQTFREAGFGPDRLEGPFETLEECLDRGMNAASQSPENERTLVFSPGCASFGKFLNEFDRGNKFRALVQNRLQGL
ncbi:MAG: UDP-N-acetylmuramoyl-L-alanine--D-glutamate ligase [Spirochaetales bacterium]|nr:UDP-N-acetylmuramoyl-L-alanine--D-glutamate ligase [Spirochaetales bacterium]